MMSRHVHVTEVLAGICHGEQNMAGEEITVAVQKGTKD